MNKSVLTNVFAALLAIAGLLLAQPHIQSAGFYALSGALTNWLAVVMLFDKIPFIYGSGVIPNRFEDFKQGIRDLIMHQFFNEENITRFFSENFGDANADIGALKDKIDMDRIFEGLLDAIMASQFGSMLGMLGGRDALLPLKEPIIAKLLELLGNISEDIEQAGGTAGLIQENIAAAVDQRLNELTPQMVKIIVQDMIRKHLGWLVVWGGIFGGLIGLAVSVFSYGI